MSAPGLEAFHLGFVVHDIGAVSNLYGRLLGISRWRVTEFDMRTIPWVDQPSDARLRIAYGRAARQTFELIQVLEGHSKSVDPRRMAYVNPGLATVQFEFCGPASAVGIREWLQEEYRHERSDVH